MRKLVIGLLMLTFMMPRISEAHSPSEIFSHDYEGASRPFTHSGFQNRWIEWMIENYALQPDDLQQGENYSYFNMEDGTFVAFEESFIADDQVIFKLTIMGDKKAELDLISQQVSLFDNEFEGDSLTEIYNDWTEADRPYESYRVGEHTVDTYHEDSSMNNAIVFRFYYPLTLFQGGDYPNLIETLHDANRPQPNIYSNESADETVYVNRLYLNRILEQLSKDWGWELSEDHLKTAGGTVFYYPQELAELKRVNEIYLFSGKISQAQRIEIRMTNDFAQGDNLQAPFLHKYYFTYFAQVLQPELTLEEINQGYDDFMQSDLSKGGYFKLADLQIKGPAFSSQTFSMARIIPTQSYYDQDINYGNTVMEGQEQAIRLNENEVHYPSVTILAPADRIYEKEDIVVSLEKASLAMTNELEEKILQIYNDLPPFGHQLEIEGEVVDVRPNIIVVEDSQAFLYQVHFQGELDISQGDWLQITGSNLGIQDESKLALAIVAEGISKNGQELYLEGVDVNEEE